MVIKAGTWLGNRVRVYDAAGAKVGWVKEIDTKTKEAVVFRLNAKGKPYGIGGKIALETVDATGWRLSFLSLFDRTI